MTTQFPALKAAEDELKAIFAAAGPEYDLTKVKSLDGKTSAEKVTHIKQLNERCDELRAVLKVAGHSGGESGSEPGGRWIGVKDLAGADRLTKGQKVTDWLKAKGQVTEREVDELSFDRYLKGMATGDWKNAEAEQAIHVKAMSEGTLTAGGHLVPTPLAANIIDLARNQMRVMQAGAVTVPMQSQTLKVPRLTSEGTPGWHTENAAITDADMVFDSVTFTARTLTRLIKLSMELFEDSDPSAGDVIAQSFAKQIALEVDRAALRGTGTAPEPRGVLNQSGITTTTHGANGTAITNYDWFLDAAGTVRASNFEPNSHIVAPRTTTSLSKLKEATTNAYMAPPSALLPLLPTSQVPITLTTGTSSDTSEIYTAQWDQLMIGVRTQLRLEFLRERYADNGQFAFLAWFRADVQLAHPAAFVVDTGVRG